MSQYSGQRKKVRSLKNLLDLSVVNVGMLAICKLSENMGVHRYLGLYA